MIERIRPECCDFLEIPRIFCHISRSSTLGFFDWQESTQLYVSSLDNRDAVTHLCRACDELSSQMQGGVGLRWTSKNTGPCSSLTTTRSANSRLAVVLSRR